MGTLLSEKHVERRFVKPLRNPISLGYIVPADKLAGLDKVIHHNHSSRVPIRLFAIVADATYHFSETESGNRFDESV
jgi:hypothetical protein